MTKDETKKLYSTTVLMRVTIQEITITNNTVFFSITPGDRNRQC